MIIAIICLVLGILGFVKRRIAVTKNRELRGPPMYAAAALLCLPLPLSILAGVMLGAYYTAQGKPLDQSTILMVGAATTWGPILLAIVLGLALAKPKAPPISGPQGFEVKM